MWFDTADPADHGSIICLCKSGAVGAQVSLPGNRTERMQALNTVFHELKEVSIGSCFLNFPTGS